MLTCGWLGALPFLCGCVQEEQQESVVGGGLQVGEFTQTLRASAQRLRNLLEKLLNVLQLLLSFTFISIFIQ